MFDWANIDTVLLDMDGTLLDLNFDNHFWIEYLPKVYAEKKQIPFEVADAYCKNLFKSAEGTLNWYCIDHWTEQLGMDIELLKQEVDHLIAVHPHVTEFLDLLAKAGKRRVLVTNAHQKVLHLKMQKTQLHDRLDASWCSHEFSLPKEDLRFWDALQTKEPFDKTRTLFVDDSKSVLKSASGYGIRYLLEILAPDTQRAVRQAGDYPAANDFDALIPGLRKYIEQER